MRVNISAKIVNSDKEKDFAIIKIDVNNLKPVTFGNSNTLKPGSWVSTIGAPFGFRLSISHGIVSAIDRKLSRTSKTTYIQTDIPTNPGNSGGPLFDLTGKVVGMVSQIFSSSGISQGISLVLPLEALSIESN